MLTLRALAGLVACAIAAVFPLLAMAQADLTPADGILIEAEDYAEKVSEVKEFASVTREPAASGRKVLVRFFEPGYVIYRLALPADGVYSGWLRYGAKGERALNVALDPGDEPDFRPARVPETGGFIGPGVWGWARIFREELAAGEHTLAIGSSPMRPDCIFITTSDEEPTDAVIRKERPALDPETERLLARPLVPVRPDWLDGAADYQLPDWYGERRVHAHTRLSPSFIEKDVFFTAAAGFREMGVRTFARHIKSGREGAWWPSAVGAILPAAQDRNLAKEIIDSAHAEGCRILVYHRHMEDEYMAEQHPDWVCRDWNGKELRSGRGAYMCFNSPYPDYLLTRSLELVDLGADGFYYDEVHMPKSGCWCDYCKQRFKDETGLDHPEEADPDDPVWQRLIDFNNLTIERTFLKWREAIHERNPELVMLVGSNTWPAMGERHMTNRLFRIADSMKTEFSLPARAGAMSIFAQDPTMQMPEKDAKLALGYTLARDACDGRPAHVWTHGLLDEASTLYAVAGVVTHGCISHLDIPENTIPNMMFRAAYELGDKVSPHFAGTVPIRWAAVHYSEHARDKHATDPLAMWKQVLYPVYGAYLALLRAHLPVGIITDSQLEEGLLDGYQVLFLPAPDDLTDAMRAMVERFGTEGGLVVRQQPGWQWRGADGGQEAAIAAFMAAVGDRVQSAPVQVTGGPERLHAVAFRSRDGTRLTVSLANDFSWVYTGRRPEADDLTEYTKAPPPCEGVSVLLRGMDLTGEVREAVSGETLSVTATDGGIEVAVPEFEYMAVVAASVRR